MNTAGSGIMDVRTARLVKVNAVSDGPQGSHEPKGHTHPERQKERRRQHHQSSHRFALVSGKPRRQHRTHRKPDHNIGVTILAQPFETIDHTFVPVSMRDGAQVLGRTGMARESHPMDAYSGGSKTLAQIAHLVGGTGQPMYQENAKSRAREENSPRSTSGGSGLSGGS